MTATTSVAKKIEYVTQEQKELLIELLSNETELLSGKFSASFTVKDAQHRWNTIATKLHEMPGAQKTWKQWRKVNI